MRQVNDLDLKENTRVCLIENQDELMQLWPLFEEGWKVISDPKISYTELTVDGCFKWLCAIVGWEPERGHGAVGVFFVDDEPVGFNILSNATEAYSEKSTLLVAANYCKHTAHTGTPRRIVGMKEFDKLSVWYARAFEYDQLMAVTARLTGASKRLYVKYMGYEPRATVFYKAVN